MECSAQPLQHLDTTALLLSARYYVQEEQGQGGGFGSNATNLLRWILSNREVAAGVAQANAARAICRIMPLGALPLAVVKLCSPACIPLTVQSRFYTQLPKGKLIVPPAAAYTAWSARTALQHRRLSTACWSACRGSLRTFRLCWALMQRRAVSSYSPQCIPQVYMALFHHASIGKTATARLASTAY